MGDTKRIFTTLEITSSIIAPTNTKGTIYAGDGTNLTPVSVGADGTALVADSAQTAGVIFATPAGTVDTSTPLAGDGTGGDPVTVSNGTNSGDGLVWNGSAWSISALPGVPTCTVDGTGGAGQFTTIAAAYTAGFRAFKIIGNTTQTGFVNNTSNDPIYFFVGSGTGAGVTWTINNPDYSNTGPVYIESYGNDGSNVVQINTDIGDLVLFDSATTVTFRNIYIIFSIDIPDCYIFGSTVTIATIDGCTIESNGNETISTGEPEIINVYDVKILHIISEFTIEITNGTSQGIINNVYFDSTISSVADIILYGNFIINNVMSYDSTMILNIFFTNARVSNCYAPLVKLNILDGGSGGSTLISNCGGDIITQTGSQPITINGLNLAGNADFTSNNLNINGLDCADLTLRSCSNARVNNVRCTNLVLQQDAGLNPHIGDLISNSEFSGTLTNTNTSRIGFSNCGFTATNTTITINNPHYRFNGCAIGTTAAGTSTITSAGVPAGDEPLVVGCTTEAALGTVNTNSAGNALF